MSEQLEEEKPIDTGVSAIGNIDARWLWDYDLLWLQFEAALRGGKLKKNPETLTWEIHLIKGAIPFMNDKGIKDFLALMRANVNVVTGSSIMTEERAMKLCEIMSLTILKMLQNNKVEYDIPESKLYTVHRTFMNAYESNIRKSIQGIALKMAMQTERRVITEQITPQQGQPGIFARILGKR